MIETLGFGSFLNYAGYFDVPKKKKHGWNEKDMWIQAMKAINLENCNLQLFLLLSMNQKIFEWISHSAYFHSFNIFAFAQYTT